MCSLEHESTVVHALSHLKCVTLVKTTHLIWHIRPYMHLPWYTCVCLSITLNTLAQICRSQFPHPSLLPRPRPSHFFQRTQEKSGRPGWSGDVIGHGLRRDCTSPPTRSCSRSHGDAWQCSDIAWVSGWRYITMPNYITRSTRPSRFFSHTGYLEKHGKAWVRDCPYPTAFSRLYLHSHSEATLTCCCLFPLVN